MMNSHSTPIDISKYPDLMHIVAEVEATKTPRQLKRDDKVVAVLSPVETKRKQKNKKSIEETLALAGSWGERNWDEVEEELDRIRHQSKPTPPFTFDDA